MKGLGGVALLEEAGFEVSKAQAESSLSLYFCLQIRMLVSTNGLNQTVSKFPVKCFLSYTCLVMASLLSNTTVTKALSCRP